jgi:LPXTG-site transpeptidase (sortase) family protein
MKKYLKWYSVPVIYFLLTSLLCAYAWVTRPIPYRAGLKAVFKTISLLPTLMLTGAITAWIILAIILVPITLWLKKRSPKTSVPRESKQYSQKEDILHEPFSKATQTGFQRKVVNAVVSALGIVLIVAGLSVAGWIARPYLAFLFSTSKIEALEKKAELLGQAEGDVKEEIEEVANIEKAPLRDVPKESQVSEKSGRHIEQAEDNVIKNSGVVETMAEVPKRSDKGTSNKNGIVEELAQRRQQEVTRKVEAMNQRAEKTAKSKENRIIIPTALVDAPILEGIDMEKLSEGVCHIPKSAVPGKGGNCIIEGHNLGEFGWWRPQGPFNMLEILEEGVLIYVFYNGKKHVYKVKEKIYTDVNDPKLYNFSPGERLTLITCTSTLDITVYTDKRTVIIAYPIES